MLLNLAALALFALPAQDAPVSLKRTFVPGLKSVYNVSSSLHLEARQLGLQTFLPHDVDIYYGFTLQVLGVTSGIGTLRYERPSITQAEAESGDEQPKKDVEKLDEVEVIQLSPVNELIDHKSLTKPKKKKDDGERMRSKLLAAIKGHRLQESLGDFIAPFIQDVERMSIFIGPLDSSMDLAPKLDLRPVKVGDTWKRTVGFQPQKMKSKNAKTEVQRLDITYSYVGTGTFNGKPSVKVHADLTLNTDLGAYLNDLVGETSEVTRIKSIPLKLKSKLDFDLDPKTLQTLHGVCDSEGGFEIVTTLYADAVEEEKIKGNTILSLVSNKMVTAPKVVH